MINKNYNSVDFNLSINDMMEERLYFLGEIYNPFVFLQELAKLDINPKKIKFTYKKQDDKTNSNIIVSTRENWNENCGCGMREDKELPDDSVRLDVCFGNIRSGACTKPLGRLLLDLQKLAERC